MRADGCSKQELPDPGRDLAFLPLRKSEARFFCHGARAIMRYFFLLFLVAFIGCQIDDNAVVDPFHLPPYLSRLNVSPSLINTDTMNVGPQRLPTDQLTISVSASAQVSDPEGLTDVGDVTLSIFKPQSQVLARRAQLQDDGKPPDAAARDGIFSGLTSFVISRSEIGDFKVEVLASDKANLTSNSMSTSITVVRLNRAPVLSDLKAPDSVSVGTSTVLLKLSVRADDPDGQSDVQKIFFNSFKPDGTLSSGSPFQMLDDGDVNGQSGDVTKGDGIYSLVVQLPPGTTKGSYRFEFQATDRSGAASSVLIHTITVR